MREHDKLLRERNQDGLLHDKTLGELLLDIIIIIKI